MGGQSNMEGVGIAAEAPPNLIAQPDVQLYHSPSVRSALPANQWNPLAPAGTNPNNFGPELSFAYCMAEMLPKQNIALIKHAKGGTKLTTEPLHYEVTSWHPGASASDSASFGAEFAAFIHTVTNALAAMRAQGDTPVLSGVLWVQGEADSTSIAAAAAYEQNITRLVARVREQFSAPNLPFVCARILPYQVRPGSAAVRQALDNIDQDSGSPAAIPHLFTVHTEGLGVHTDNVHFNTPGQLGLGRLLAQSMSYRGLEIPRSTPPHSLAYWQFDEASNAAYLLDVVGVYHLDQQIAATPAPALVERASQPAKPLFIDGTPPQVNPGSLMNSHGMRRLYDAALDMRDQPWTFEAFFRNNAVGTHSAYEVIGGTRSAMSQYYGWRVIMINGQIRFFATANNGQVAHVLTTLRFDDGCTHHLAAVWEPADGAAGKMRLYVDGNFAGESTGAGDLGDDATFAKRFALGGNISGTKGAPVINSNLWNGSLDELRFTPRALQPRSFLRAFPKGTTLEVSAVNPLDRIYPDLTPYTSEQAAHLPRGGRAYFQFALHSTAHAGSVRLSAASLQKENGTVLKDAACVQVLRAVQVEANYGGCARTQVNKVPPGSVRESIVRQAPFNVYEVVTDKTAISLDGSATYAAIARVDVSRDAEPGLYHGVLTAALGDDATASAPLALRVYQTTLHERQPLDVIHWLWPEPQNLTDEAPPEWWSEPHWQLLEASGRTLRDYGDTVLFTPLFATETPLIQVIADTGSDHSWSFGFSRFDRWVTTFKELGFTRFFGKHINNHRSVFTWDQATGAVRPLNLSFEEYHQNFLPAFYAAFYKHLCQRGWQDSYIQALTDEPRLDALQRYQQMVHSFRKHMPGIGIAEALNHEFDQFSEFVDVPAWWFGYVYSKDWPDLIQQRIDAGKENWVYYACSPTPPHPNSHLDVPLWRSRALPWVVDYCRASGLLHWAANGYRGADPYTSSIGPLPNGSTAPGHPPGDNWLFYPTAKGLTGSMRMVALQQGIEDYTLLKMLRAKDPDCAAAIADSIVHAMVLDYRNKDIRSEYANNAASYSAARQQLLERLDSIGVAPDL
ncbi:MAG: sialate O-acetylesterase [Kiritimatiellae bacterium]|nr:sialate O-acetylesterase [Kiritimatiellia bacterium]